MAHPFSRLQLAAALLEYDNDPDDPDAPYRNAQESAIFAHLRRNTLRPKPAARKSSDYLGVALPSETGSAGLEDGRRSRSSIDALRNPFRESVRLEDEEETTERLASELEVDLSSWGLDAFIPKDKKKALKGKGKAIDPHPISTVSARIPKASDPSDLVHSRSTRSLSVGNYDHLTVAIGENRRKSFGSPLDLVGVETDLSFPEPVAPSGSYDNPVSYNNNAVPFPSRSIRSPSPFPEDGPSSRVPHQRMQSSVSIDSRMRLNNDTQSTMTHSRVLSNGSMTSRMYPDETNPFSLRPPTRASRFDPKAAAHARTVSNASLGSRILLADDGTSVMTEMAASNQHHDHAYSAIDLLRPKVLVMPSPLQSTLPPPPPPDPKTKDGFLVSTDGPPLPPGARTSRRMSSFDALNSLHATPVASNSFTPNPRMNLSLSQLTFRNNLIVGGQRDVAYSDIDRAMPRATQEGEQVQPYQDEVEPPVVLVDETDLGPRRPPGKLYGKSLIDDLESRKEAMRGKQRVFRGDDRPSMMSRNRSSTLIDPSTLVSRPESQRMSSYGSSGNLGRRNSTLKPLLNFEGEKVPTSPTQIPPTAAKSVFGHDSLWEREMAKLKEMEAAERAEAEERERRLALAEAAANLKQPKGKKKKGKQAAAPITEQLDVPIPTVDSTPEQPRVSIEPPVLPVIQPGIRGPPPVIDDDDDSGSENEDGPRITKVVETEGWNANSSDDEAEPDKPRRTTGVGLRNPANLGTKQAAQDDDSSEEDIPLSAALRKVKARSHLALPDDDSDEEEPLSVVLRKAQSKSTLLPPMNFDTSADDDDDKPLGLRASRVLPSTQSQSNAGGDDDDMPLAFHPEQQRRTQYAMLAQQQQQQQQQQMMMQAQMHNSMFFNPNMMGSGFFAPPMGPPPVMVPMQIPSPPPVPDPAKFGRVDQWRRDVAVEGEP